MALTGKLLANDESATGSHHSLFHILRKIQLEYNLPVPYVSIYVYCPTALMSKSRSVGRMWPTDVTSAARQRFRTHLTYAPPSQWRTTFTDLLNFARTVRFDKHHLSSNGIPAYSMGRYRYVQNFTVTEVRKIRKVNFCHPPCSFSFKQF